MIEGRGGVGDGVPSSLYHIPFIFHLSHTYTPTPSLYPSTAYPLVPCTPPLPFTTCSLPCTCGGDRGKRECRDGVGVKGYVMREDEGGVEMGWGKGICDRGKRGYGDGVWVKGYVIEGR